MNAYDYINGINFVTDSFRNGIVACIRNQFGDKDMNIPFENKEDFGWAIRLRVTELCSYSPGAYAKMQKYDEEAYHVIHQAAMEIAEAKEKTNVNATIKRMLDLGYTDIVFHPSPEIKHAGRRYRMIGAAYKDGNIIVIVDHTKDELCQTFILDGTWNKISTQNILNLINAKLDAREKFNKENEEYEKIRMEARRQAEQKEKEEMELRKLENYKKDIKKSQRKDLLEAALAIYGYAEPTVVTETTVEETLEIIETPFGILVHYELTVTETVAIEF